MMPVQGQPSRQAILQKRLAEAEDALHRLQIGEKEVVVSYSSGDGLKSVTYSRAEIDKLSAYVNSLKLQLGQGGSRRPFVPTFGGWQGHCRPWRRW